MLGFKSYTEDTISEVDVQLDYYNYLSDNYGHLDEEVGTLAEHTYNPDLLYLMWSEFFCLIKTSSWRRTSLNLSTPDVTS